jgi:hypothetical protein
MASIANTSSTALNFLASEADSLLEQARKYRAEMEALAPDDPRREVYEKMILDYLERSRRLSSAVAVSAKSA